MLHENPLMADIDVNHWRNMQELLLDSAKARKRIILIHENGELLKFIHSHRSEIVKNVMRVDDPKKVAEQVYRDNPGKADFVMVLERRAVEQFFAKVQDTWKAAEDLDVYVHRMFVTLDEYPEGIATYPGTARHNLGLQWRLGAEHEVVEAAVEKFIPANSTIIFGVFEGDKLWGSLVLGFDADKKVINITTADPTELKSTGDWKTQAKELVNWTSRKYSNCAMGFFTDLANARDFLKSKEKLTSLKAIAKQGKLLIDPAPATLGKIVA